MPGFHLSLADQCLLEGFNAALDVARRKLTVIMDQNADNVGLVMYAVVSPGVSIEVQTELGLDPRFVMSAEVRATDDPVLESQARVQDDSGKIWKIVRIERNAASPINKYWCAQVEEGLDQ